MPAYVVCYDLYTPGQKYDCLQKKLEAYGTYCHLQGSVWIISTNSNAASIRDNLNTCLDYNDKLFVGQLSGEAAWAGASDETTKWLKNVL